MFDLFDFTPVKGDPFHPQGATPPADEETPEMKAGEPVEKWNESYAEAAKNPANPMALRIGSGMVELAKQYGMGLKNKLETFMGPVYGQGSVPQGGWNTPGEIGADYAGAGLNLASTMVGPGGESGLGAGWNPKAEGYLNGLLKKKPALKPETAAAVKGLIEKGPDHADELAGTPGVPGSGYANLALMTHANEETAKVAQEAGQVHTTEAAKPWVKPISAAKPGVDYSDPDLWNKLKVPQVFETPTEPGISLWGTTAKPKPAPKVKTKTSTTLTPEEALGLKPTQSLDDVFKMKLPDLTVPTMNPHVPGATGTTALGMETAPGTSGQILPFNPDKLPMDVQTVQQRMQEGGFRPIGNNWLFWRAAQQHGPFSWDSAEMGWKDPASKTNEPGLFLAPHVSESGQGGKDISLGYGGAVNPHVVRADNPLVQDWKDVGGGKAYSSVTMQKAIKDAWAKGHDALLLKNLYDIKKGMQSVKQDQLIVRKPEQLRHPHAVFNPKYRGKANLLSAGGPGAVMPMLATDNSLAPQPEAAEQVMEENQGGE